MPIKPYLLSQYALLILSITNRFYATSPRGMVELISSLENNSFASHSFRKVRRTVALARSMEIRLVVDEWFALSRIFVFVPLGRRFSTERQVDRSAFASSRLLSVARRIRPCLSNLFVS